MLQQGLLAGKSDFWIDLEKNLLGIMIYKKFYSAFAPWTLHEKSFGDAIYTAIIIRHIN